MIWACSSRLRSSFVGQCFGFAGVLDDEGAISDLGLQHVPGAFEEDEGVVVGGGTSIEIERVAGAFGVVNQVLGLLGTNSQAVEGDVVIDGIGVTDQTVVGNDAYTSGFGCVGGGGSGRAILRGDDDEPARLW